MDYKKTTNKGDKEMRILADQIIKAQDALIKKYGEEDYKRLINKLKGKTNNEAFVLIGLYEDESLDSVIRLGALACLGE